MPMTLPLPGVIEPLAFENVEGCEYVNGEWVEKHPTEWIEAEHDRRGCEFVDGDWKEKNLSASSDLVIVRLLSELEQHARPTKLGRVQGPECGYQCFPVEPKRVRKPDVSFMLAGRLPASQRKGNVRIAPDFAAEVTSPNDIADDLGQKVMEYLSVGVKLVWIVYPETKSVWVFRSDGTGSWHSISGELSGEDVIPGFKTSLDTLFADD